MRGYYWEIEGNYGCGYECVYTCETRKEALKELANYIENEAKQFSAMFRIIRRRMGK